MVLYAFKHMIETQTRIWFMYG